MTICNLPLREHESTSQACSFHSFTEDIRQILILIPLFVWHQWLHVNSSILNSWNKASKSQRLEQQPYLDAVWLGKRNQTPKALLHLLMPVSVQVPAQHIQTRTGKEWDQLLGPMTFLTIKNINSSVRQHVNRNANLNSIKKELQARVLIVRESSSSPFIFVLKNLKQYFF